MKRVLKWVGYIVGGLIVVILLAVGTVYAVTSARMAKTYPLAVQPVAVPSDSASIARGRHLVETVGKCQGCHGDNFAGETFSDDVMFARLNAPNLTSGKDGIGATYTNEDWVRTLRYGVARDGKSVRFMPSEAFTYFNDTDLGQIIAYVKSVPPADAKVPRARQIGPVMRALSLFADFPLVPASIIDRDMSRAPIPEAATKEYGEYLVNTGICSGCHGPGLRGGQAGGFKTPNLTPSGELGKWTEADFVKAIRTGYRPDGRQLSTFMPWQRMKGLTDTELSAMWAYLHSVEPAPVPK